MIAKSLNFFFILCCISGALSTTLSPAGLVKKAVGESGKLQWTVNGTFINYTINSLANGNPAPLGSNTNTTFDQAKGVVTLLIWNIQVSNAGIYQLFLETGSSPDLYSIGTLFVYAVPFSSVTMVSGPNPATEGATIELNCTVSSNSQPTNYLTKIYYFWNIGSVAFQNISSGPAITVTGDVVSRYMIKNDGRTIVITSAQAFDNQISCQGQEDGSPLKSNLLYYGSPFVLFYKPFATSFTPSSRRYTGSAYSNLWFYIYFSANPLPISYTNWTHSDSSGSTREFPVNNATIPSNYIYLSLNSPISYGNYSITLTNHNGSTTETVYVMPPGPPDAPSEFSVQYVTHSIVSLKWHCMWWNGYTQTVFLRLIEFTTNTEVDTQITTISDSNCYNSSFATVFRRNIKPNTQYQAFMWSANQLGSSNVQSLTVTTQSTTTLYVSCEDITVAGSQAVINVATNASTLVWLNVTCCVELTAECITQSYTLLTPKNQVVFNNLPIGDNFVFGFALFNGDFYNYVYVLAVFKGIPVSTTSSCSMTGNDQSCQNTLNRLRKLFLITTIVLAVLLGISALLHKAMCIGFCVWKCRKQKVPSNLRQLPRPSQTTIKDDSVRTRPVSENDYENFDPAIGTEYSTYIAREEQ